MRLLSVIRILTILTYLLIYFRRDLDVVAGGSVIITIEAGTNGVTTMSRMNFSGYVGHVTIFVEHSLLRAV